MNSYRGTSKINENLVLHLKIQCLQSSTLATTKCSTTGHLGMLVPKENLLYGGDTDFFYVLKDSCQEVTPL